LAKKINQINILLRINMNSQNIIDLTQKYIKERLSGEGSGHDWWHVLRVWKVAKKIAEEEQANVLVVELAALLHDIADWKFNEGDILAGGRAAKDWLKKNNISDEIISSVVEIINGTSFKGANVEEKQLSLEGQIVRDADRLDAIGAMGIGRTFSYGGNKNREMYNPEVEVKMASNFEEYKKAGQTTINHFYEKLLLLKDRMHTKTAKRMAKNRHKFMEAFLDEFFAEWNGKK
jgi:uncharacterized protein